MGKSKNSKWLMGNVYTNVLLHIGGDHLFVCSLIGNLPIGLPASLLPYFASALIAIRNRIGFELK